MKLFPALCLLLAAPAFAQDPGEAAEACLADIDSEAVGVRAEAFMTARDAEARVDALCAAGDAAGAAALAEEVTEAFYAGDAEAARMRACIVAAFGEEAVAIGDVCAD